eukprot:TRINITY_DN13227_c0_g1_i1.p1 TRINITY_DN13227_c0_g1~~TRINITY_DN13227_c0_g1_i1.p1  ORF type:complete len:116 (-),score=22.99 TRINITY_DN13227_c0_g1_i1:85-432(-)
MKGLQCSLFQMRLGWKISLKETLTLWSLTLYCKGLLWPPSWSLALWTSQPPQNQDSRGSTMIIKIREDGQIVANDVPAKMIAGEGKNQIFVLEKLLFIRPEDVVIGAERAKGAAK